MCLSWDGTLYFPGQEEPVGQLRQQEEHLHGGHFIAFCVTLGSVTRFLYLVKKGMDADLIGSLVV